MSEHKLLVAMVERWSQLGDPTTKARLAQIRALLDLCMMDRAWTRLQALRTEDRHDRTRLELTARMFVERGWPKRARKVLAEAVEKYPDHPAWARLDEAASAPPRRPPSEEPPPDATVHDRLQVAEIYLATGAYLKARRLLASLEQEAGGERVSDLLWALRGDYDLHGQSLHELVDRYAPAAGAFGDLPDLDDDPDNTDSITVADIPFASTWDGGSGAFPSMFLGEDEDDDDTGGDVTQCTSVDELNREVGQPVSFGEDDQDDTQVLRVVRKEKLIIADDEFSPPTSPGIVDELEGEDDAVVVLTRRQERQPPHRNEPPLPLETPAPQPAPPVVESRPTPALIPPPPPSGLTPAQIGLLGLAILFFGVGTLCMAIALFGID